MNVFSIVSSLASAAGVLAAAGVKIPPAITNTLTVAVPVMNEVSNGVAPSATAPSANVTALVQAGLEVLASGNQQADSFITTALKEITLYRAQVESYEAGQPIVLATSTVSIKGVQHKSYTIEALDTSELVKNLGL